MLMHEWQHSQVNYVKAVLSNFWRADSLYQTQSNRTWTPCWSILSSHLKNPSLIFSHLSALVWFANSWEKYMSFLLAMFLLAMALCHFTQGRKHIITCELTCWEQLPIALYGGTRGSQPYWLVDQNNEL